MTGSWRRCASSLLALSAVAFVVAGCGGRQFDVGTAQAAFERHGIPLQAVPAPKRSKEVWNDLGQDLFDVFAPPGPTTLLIEPQVTVAVFPSAAEAKDYATAIGPYNDVQHRGNLVVVETDASPVTKAEVTAALRDLR